MKNLRNIFELFLTSVRTNIARVKVPFKIILDWTGVAILAYVAIQVFWIFINWGFDSRYGLGGVVSGGQHVDTRAAIALWLTCLLAQKLIWHELNILPWKTKRVGKEKDE